MLNLGLEAELPASCLNVSEQVITLAGDHVGETAINNLDYLTDGIVQIDDGFHLKSVEVCLEEPESHSDHEHRAIIGLAANLANADGETRNLPVIGDMGCSDGEYRDDMRINGSNVGQLRLNFETNGDGVAFRIIDRSRDKRWTLAKGGERD